MANTKLKLKKNTKNEITNSILNLVDILIKHFLHDVKKSPHTSSRHTNANDFAYWFYSPDPFSGMPKESEIMKILKDKTRNTKVFFGDFVAKVKGEWDQEITQGGVTKIYNKMDADRKIAYFEKYYNKVKPAITIDTINDEYYYKLDEEKVNTMLKRKPGHWKMRNPTYRYEGEVPAFESVLTTPRYTIKYRISFTTDWLFMQKDGLLRESTLYLRKNSLEFEQAVKDFAMGFKLDSAQSSLNKPSTLNIVLKNKYIINNTWEAEAVIEGNKVSIEFEAKVCETKINNINIMGKFGLQFSAEIFLHPEHPQHPLPAADVNWEQIWEDALTGLKIVGAIVLTLAISLYRFATGLWFFIVDPTYDDPYLMGPNQMCKIDQAKQEKDKGDV